MDKFSTILKESIESEIAANGNFTAKDKDKFMKVFHNSEIYEVVTEKLLQEFAQNIEITGMDEPPVQEFYTEIRVLGDLIELAGRQGYSGIIQKSMDMLENSLEDYKEYKMTKDSKA